MSSEPFVGVSYFDSVTSKFDEIITLKEDTKDIIFEIRKDREIFNIQKEEIFLGIKHLLKLIDNFEGSLPEESMLREKEENKPQKIEEKIEEEIEEPEVEIKIKKQESKTKKTKEAVSTKTKPVDFVNKIKSLKSEFDKLKSEIE